MFVRGKTGNMYEGVDFLGARMIDTFQNRLGELKATGDLGAFLTLDPSDPKHPYFYEHEWTNLLQRDPESRSFAEETALRRALCRRAWYGYDRYGLMADDIGHGNWLVDQAIDRMPLELKQAREQRIIRAYELDFQKRYLPEEEWTHPEDDNAYLAPYLGMVVHRAMERGDTRLM